MVGTTLLADRGFRDHQDWHYVIRLGLPRYRSVGHTPRPAPTGYAALIGSLSVGWTQPTNRQPAEWIHLRSTRRPRTYRIIEQSFKEDKSGTDTIDPTSIRIRSIGFTNRPMESRLLSWTATIIYSSPRMQFLDRDCYLGLYRISSALLASVPPHPRRLLERLPRTGFKRAGFSRKPNTQGGFPSPATSG